MGTNFYWLPSPCPTCGHGERLHIGKSSAGWTFALHVAAQDWEAEEGLPRDLDGWRALWARPGSRIVDEYGATLTPEEMNARITQREWRRSAYASNSAVPGPNGLVRHRVDGVHCIGHGEGTWDLIAGVFS